MQHFYRDIQGWTDDGLEDAYKKAVADVPDGGLMVEVGVWRGRSLCFLGVEVLNSKKDILICGVDHFRGGIGEIRHQEMLEESDVRAECVANIHKVGNILLLDGPSVKAAQLMAPADFVFLDGSHDYESVCEDIRAWREVVKPGGVLAGHDYFFRPVQVAVKDLLPTAQRFSHTVWWWQKPNHV